MKGIRFSIMLGLILFLGSSSLWSWGELAHRRLTYWAWKHAELPASCEVLPCPSGDDTVPVVWNLDSIETVLGDYALKDFISVAFTGIAGARFEADNTEPDGPGFEKSIIPAATPDSIIFQNFGEWADIFDENCAAMKAQWGHMYNPDGMGFSDGMCQFFFNKAVKTYSPYDPAKIRRAYAYLGLAAHYLEDTGFSPHNEKDYLNPDALAWQFAHHTRSENWIADSTNWFSYFDAACDSFSKKAILFCCPLMTVHNLAWVCMWDAKPFEQTWLEETKYSGCLGKGWDNPTNWNKELRAAKPKTVELAINCIRKIQPRLVGLFLAFKAQTRNEELAVKANPAVIPDSGRGFTIDEDPYQSEQPDTIHWYRLRNDDMATPIHSKNCLSAAVPASINDTVAPAPPTGLSTDGFEDSIAFNLIPPFELDLTGFNIYQGSPGCKTVYIYEHHTHAPPQTKHHRTIFNTVRKLLETK